MKSHYPWKLSFCLHFKKTPRKTILERSFVFLYTAAGYLCYYFVYFFLGVFLQNVHISSRFFSCLLLLEFNLFYISAVVCFDLYILLSLLNNFRPDLGLVRLIWVSISIPSEWTVKAPSSDVQTYIASLHMKGD